MKLLPQRGIAPGTKSHSERPQMKLGTYFVQTWGCQMNEEDSEQMSLYLQDLGFKPVDSIFQAQIILLNTCSVRRKPEDKAFSLLGELAPLKRKHPEVIIGVCGCMAQARAMDIRRSAPHVDFVLGTGDLGQLPGLVEEAAQKHKFQKRLALPERKGAVVEDIPQRHLGRPAKLKSFVPIQYGCDKFCTFCIVPTTRGRERSRPTEHILEEVATLASLGTKEITLLGQTVNSYGKNLLEGRVPFSKLLWQLAEIPGLERIRYTSPYPRDFKTDLIEAVRDCPKVMEHCHMPLQAGDDNMLKEMHRLYTVDSFTKIVEELREAVPGISITTDVIVGFPGETDEQFENTLKTMERLRFDAAYMFAYSIRPGTPAGDRKDQIPDHVKKERLARMIEMQNRITCEIHSTFVGKEIEVLLEGPANKDPKNLYGHARDIKTVTCTGSPDRAGRIGKVKVLSSHLWGLHGELV